MPVHTLQCHFPKYHFSVKQEISKQLDPTGSKPYSYLYEYDMEKCSKFALSVGLYSVP